MQTLFFICLAIAWAFFLVPSVMRKHREGRPASSVVSFRRQLSTLERATPGTSLRPIPYRTAPLGGTATGAPLARTQGAPVRSSVVQRRQQVLVGLGGATAFAFLLLLVASSTVTFLLFAVTAGSLGAYVYALVQIRRRADEAAAKVRVLRPQPAPRAVRTTPALAVRRTAHS